MRTCMLCHSNFDPEKMVLSHPRPSKLGMIIMSMSECNKNNVRVVRHGRQENIVHLLQSACFY